MMTKPVTLPEHFFVSSVDGALFDTRRAAWSARPPREVYRRTFARIENTLELRATLRAGPYAWPGGYPMYFIASDGEALSFESVRENYVQVSCAIRGKLDDDWRVVACDINYEDAELTCAHSGKRIPSAYE